ncbi:hypothetical protein, partial [Hydrogenibacillus schlegelii]|uniref:hypothetical protein n=1 Tax=Hydrogenibacillus schlegelii TaxID=1484 RepID=UPI001B8055D0
QLCHASIPLKEAFQNLVVHGNLVLSHPVSLLVKWFLLRLTFYQRGPDGSFYVTWTIRFYT